MGANCESRTPVVCFKASTILQGLGIISLRQFLVSGDKEAQSRSRSYCPTTYKYAEEFHTPGDYSDQLVQHATPAALAHECVIPVVCNMSSKAASHAPTSVALGMIVPLCSYYQPKTERAVKLCVGFWMIEGEELALAIGMVSALSSNPLSLAARALTEGTISNDELPTAFPTGVYGCAR